MPNLFNKSKCPLPGPDFVFVSGDSQEDTAEKITERYCLEIQESGIENVQILSPFRSEGAASSEQLNETIRELVNPFRSAEEEIKFGPRIFRVNDRIMQTKTQKRSLMEIWASSGILRTLTGRKIGPWSLALQTPATLMVDRFVWSNGFAVLTNTAAGLSRFFHRSCSFRIPFLLLPEVEGIHMEASRLQIPADTFSSTIEDCLSGAGGHAHTASDTNPHRILPPEGEVIFSPILMQCFGHAS